MLKSVYALLAGIVDYAGLFPPASLAMVRAVTNYAAYRESDAAWMLGRFILPITHLGQWEDAITLLPASSAEGCQLSVLASDNLRSDLTNVRSFNHRHRGTDGTVIDTIEFKATHAAEITAIMTELPPTLAAYVEIPIDDALPELMATMAQTGARAKVRTGGVVPDAFPSAADLLRFISTCHHAHVPFKATAGLHHPLRSTYRLTYEPGSAVAPMYGFLNLFLCAALLQAGTSEQAVTQILEESSPSAFRFDDAGVTWGPHRLTLDELQRTRQTLALSFGSCSFTEPIDELKAINLL